MSSKTSPTAADDLKRITGVGVAIEKRLHRAGILTFSQLAEWDFPALYDLVSDIAGYSLERIAEEDWPGQARKLVLEAAPSGEAQSDTSSTGDGQRDVSFTVNLLLNEDHSVRRTRVVDNRSKTPVQWAGWNEHRMIDFISRQAALQLPVAAPAEPEPAAVIVAGPVPAESATPEPDAITPALVGFGGTLHLQELEPIPAGTASVSHVFNHSLPFSVRLHLDLTEVELPGDDRLDYTATIYAKRLGGGLRETIGEVNNTITPQDRLAILVDGKPLPPGTYRLDAMVMLSHPSAELDLRAYQEGGMFHVY